MRGGSVAFMLIVSLPLSFVRGKTLLVLTPTAKKKQDILSVALIVVRIFEQSVSTPICIYSKVSTNHWL